MLAAQENTPVLQALHDSGAEFRASAEGLPESQANTRPGPGRWSVVDCIEHIVMAESYFLTLLAGPQDQAAPPPNHEKEAALLTNIASRERRVQAPERSHPTGRFATLAEALEKFDATRRRTIAFAVNRGEGLYSVSATHPFFGPLNGAEVLCLMAAHSRRHAAQIREVRGEL
jgi:hypothetical protein